jgi:osmotically-inducible protein OsmY
MSRVPYPTSDEILRKAILASFASNDQNAFANLRVGVSNGIVHLVGGVASLEARIIAAEIAGGIQGVRGVVNRIDAPGAPSPARTVNLDLQNKKGHMYE